MTLLFWILLLLILHSCYTAVVAAVVAAVAVAAVDVQIGEYPTALLSQFYSVCQCPSLWNGTTY